MAKSKPVTIPPAADLRAWAKDNGHEVGARGVISSAVVEAYVEAQA